MRTAAPAFALLLATGGCVRGEGDAPAQTAAATLPVTITSGGRDHMFRAELARTAEEQARGLMYRTDLSPDFAMLFAPYPAGGGGPREASFWMRNTPSPLDIVFIRADGTIARISENTIPMSDAPVTSGEPVVAVLEVRGGRTAELGIGEGDTVRWTQPSVEGAGPAG